MRAFVFLEIIIICQNGVGYLRCFILVVLNLVLNFLETSVDSSSKKDMAALYFMVKLCLQRQLSPLSAAADRRQVNENIIQKEKFPQNSADIAVRGRI